MPAPQSIMQFVLVFVFSVLCVCNDEIIILPRFSNYYSVLRGLKKERNPKFFL